MKNKTLVLDTSAFIGGFDPLTFPEKQYTVDEVKNELNSGSMMWVRFHTAIESGKIIILQPQEQYVQKVLEASKDLGDMRLPFPSRHASFGTGFRTKICRQNAISCY